MRSLLAVPGIENLSDAGRKAVLTIADSLGTDPDYLVTVMSFESARTFSPAKKNAAGSGATGLIQFMVNPGSWAAGKGYTGESLSQMSQEEQILGPVYQYFEGWRGHLNSLDDVYLAVFFPSAIGKNDDYIVGDRDGTEFQQKVYEQNRGFDSSNSGVIRRSDIVRTIRGVYNSAQANGRVNVPDAPGLWRPFFNIALFAGFAFTTYALVQWGRDRTIKTPTKLFEDIT